MSTKGVFKKIPCLTSEATKLNGLELFKKWFKNGDRRYVGEFLHKFIEYNKENLQFLEVTAIVEGVGDNSSLILSTSKYVGAIPMREPGLGKQIGDLIVSPRYHGHYEYEEYTQLIELLGEAVSVEQKHSLPLDSGNFFRPPLYLEAIEFIILLEQLIRSGWFKFSSTEMLSQEPEGIVNWSKYAEREYKVENRLLFPVRKNILSQQHSEYSNIKYVFDICKHEINSRSTPVKVRNRFGKRIQLIETKLYGLKPKQTKNLKKNISDQLIVKEIKIIANNILGNDLNKSIAWRVDFADIFEKYIAYIFKKSAAMTGGDIVESYRINGESDYFYSWELAYLEPDIIYKKEDKTIIIDAKYKSHLYNRGSDSESLYATYREDLHQVMAYSSFSEERNKHTILCYPYSRLFYGKTTYYNSINSSSNTITLIGIPPTKQSLNDNICFVSKVIRNAIND